MHLSQREKTCLGIQSIGQKVSTYNDGYRVSFLGSTCPLMNFTIGLIKLLPDPVEKQSVIMCKQAS